MKSKNKKKVVLK